MGLRKFDPSELALDNQEAWQTLVFFFGGNASALPGWLTENDRSFAQALLVEAIDKSYAMSWVEELFSSSISPSATVKSILKSLAKKAVKDWFKRAKLKDLKDPTIYQSVKNQLARNWRSAWQIRIETGDPVY